MSFSQPTTKEEMYNILKDIFYHYRIQREPIDGVNLEPIILERLEYDPRTQNELNLLAKQLLLSKHTQERQTLLNKIEQKNALATQTLAKLPEEKQAKINAVNTAHNESVQKLQAEAIKNGVIGSSIYFDKLTELETNKNALLLQIENDFSTRSLELTNQISLYEQEVEQANAFRDLVEEQEITAKINELNLEQEEKAREVFKYNNGLDEKEQRYANTIKQTNASLLLKFMSVRQGEFTKDELIEMGYYKDVIDCVCAYYDTLEPLTAAREIMEDQEVCVYLDEYYQSVVYIYTQRVVNNIT